MNENELVDVVFRVWTKKPFVGDVMALFPTVAGDDSRQYCTSYEHIGQHGHADYAYCLSQSRRATLAEYAPLKAELEAIGYTFRVRQRQPFKR